MRTKTLLIYLGLLIAGALFPLSLAPLSYWPVAVISMAALFLTLPQQSAKEAFKRSTIFGLGMFGTGVSWVFVSMYFFGDISFLCFVLILRHLIHHSFICVVRPSTTGTSLSYSVVGM